ncbi:AraC family transcriptional regulator, partial [Empedobacter sp. GD03861]
NYNTYINELRIDYICKKIATDPKFRKYKITYLAEVCGFSSYNTFTTIFKNTTGMSPSSFLKEAILQDLK